MTEILAHLIIFELFIIMLIEVDLSELRKITAASCKLCKKTVGIVDDAAGIQRHSSEVLITSNCDIQTKEDIVKSNGCRGTIYSYVNIVTTATCFDNQNVSARYCIYGHFSNVYDDQKFRRFLSDTITFHPNFNYTTGEYDLAVIKVSESINFDDKITYTKLPDDPINTNNFQDNDCYIIGYDTDTATQKLQTFSAKVQLLNYDECVDMARINSANVTMNPKQYCVLSNNVSQFDNFHIVGKGVICKNVVSGLLTKQSLQLTEDIMTPIVDVGKYTTWLRSKMLNLKPVTRSLAGFVYMNNVILITTLLFILVV